MARPGTPDRVLWSFIAAGTLVRFLFGWSLQLWNSSPDQLSWGLALEDIWRGQGDGFDQWVHYPHEGGTLLMSALAWFFIPFASLMPPLSWVALLMDTVARTVQLFVAQRVMGANEARLFAWWSVLAVPLMMPWGVVNMGGHALVSFAPFVLLLLVGRPRTGPLFSGVCIGILVSFSYDALLLAPVYLLQVLYDEPTWVKRLRKWSLFVLAVLLGCAPHLLVRSLFDHGFQLEAWSLFSIRGLERQALEGGGVATRFMDLLHTWLPASLFMAPVNISMVRVLVVLTFVAMVMALVGFIRSRRSVSVVERAAGWLVLVFLLVTAATPFFVPRSDGQGYVYYRYFPFVVPLVSLLVITGLYRWRAIGPWLSRGWVIVCGLATLIHWSQQRTYPVPLDEGTGWVLGRKYGHTPERLLRIVEGAEPSRRAALYYGAAWGTTSAMFDGHTEPDDPSIARFEGVMHRWPSELRPRFNSGVQRAFDPGVTPRLDPKLLPRVQRVLEDQ
jgi:hypothetical protein